MNYPDNLERKIARATINRLLAAGYDVGVNDGEATVVDRTDKIAVATKAMYSTDEDYLLAIDRQSGRCIGWVRLIYGNGEDLISDYTNNLAVALGDAP